MHRFSEATLTTNLKGLFMKIKKCSLALILTSLCSQLWATDKLIEPPMVTVPAGEFLMGGGPPYMGSEQVAANALPIHKVTIETFKAGKYEVTVKEFRQFIEATGYEAPKSCYHQPNEGWFSQGSTQGSWNENDMTTSEYQPVVCLDWKAATAYANWLSQQTGKSYRLLSEAEWEYTARAGSTTKFHFGNDSKQKNICEYANVSDITAERGAHKLFGATYMGFMGGITQCDDGAEFISIVGMYKPNAYGVYDMIGNVVEAVQDCGNENYQGAPTDGSAWLTGNCEERVGRGGGWHWRGFHSSIRGIGPASWVGSIEGFRLAQDLDKDINLNRQQGSSPSTLKFEKALASAQKVERNRRKNVLPVPAKPSGLSLNTNAKSGYFELSWEANSDANVSGYNVYRSLAYGARYNKIATNISALKFIDKTPSKRKHSYVIAATNPDRLSQFSDAVSTEDTTTSVPGIIQAENYNQMQGVGIGNIGDEEDAGGGLNLTGSGGINKDDWVEYLIHVKSSGFYQLNYRIASADGSDGFQLLIDDKVNSTQSVPATGGWREWQTASSKKLHLEAGQHKIKIKAVASGWKLNWFSFVAS